MKIKIVGFNLKKANDCGGYQKPKGHLDTQMFPECSDGKCTRDIVKKTVEERRKKFNLKKHNRKKGKKPDA